MKWPFVIVAFVTLCISSWGTVRNVQTNCGATGNGSTDDTAAINTCIGQLVSGDTLLFPAGTYKTTSTLTITVSNVIVDGSNNTATIKCNGGTSCLNLGNSSLTGSTPLTADALTGVTSFQGNVSTLSITAGSYVELEEGGVDVARSITDPLSCSTATPCRSEIVKVLSVSGSGATAVASIDTTLQTVPGVHWPFHYQTPTSLGCSSPYTACPLANGAHVYRVQNPTIGVTLKNLTLDGTGGSGEAGLFVLGLMNSTVSGMVIKNFTNECIGGFYVYNPTFTNNALSACGAAGGHGAINIKNEGHVIVNGMTFKSMRSDSWPWFIGGGADNTINNVEVDGGGVVTSRMFNVGAMSYSTFSNLNVHNASTSSIDNNVSLQYYAQYLTFINSVSNVGGTTAGWMGFGNDNTFNTFINSSASGNTGWAMSVGRSPSDDTNWTVDGGTWSGLASPGNDVFNFINSGHTIRNTSISGPGGWGINFNTVTGSCINNNTFVGSSGLASGGIFTSSSTVTGIGNTMNGNSSNLAAGTCGSSPSPSSLTFPAQTVGTSSSSQPVALVNNTSSPITVAQVLPIGDYSQTNNCGTLSASGGSCIINVTFKPTITGTRIGYILAYPVSNGGTAVVALSGTGGTPLPGGSQQSMLAGGTRMAGGAFLGSTLSGGPLTYSARTDNSVNCTGTGTPQTDCIAGRTTGETGSALIFQEGPSDPIPANFLPTTITFGSCPSGLTPSAYPAYCPAPMNSMAIDPDFGSTLVMASDDNTQPGATPWGTVWSPGTFSYDESLVVIRNGGGNALLLNVNPASIHAKTCATSPCVNKTGIYGLGGGNSTHFISGAVVQGSPRSTEPRTFYELSNLLINKLVVTSSIASPGTGTLTRTPYVDFTKNVSTGGPVDCGVLPPITVGANTSNYQVKYTGIFNIGSDGSVGFVLGGAYDWLPSWTPADGIGNTLFILPLLNNPSNHGYQMTTLGTTGVTEPVWNGAGCTSYTAGATCADNGGVWTDIGGLGGQGPGFNIVAYQPAVGCSLANTRLGKVYRGTGNTASSGLFTTNDPIASTRATGVPGNTVTLPDHFTIHDGALVASGTYLVLAPTGGENLNPPGNWNSGTLTCQPGGSGDVWAGAWNSTTTYASKNTVSYTDLAGSPTTAYYVATTQGSNTNRPPSTGGVVNTLYWTRQEAYCPNYIWNIGTTLMQPTTAWGPTSGHTGNGYLYRYYNGHYNAGLWGTPSSQLVPPNGPITLNPGTALLPSGLCSDDHANYRNAGPLDLQPVPASVTDVPAWITKYICAGYDEIIALANVVTGSAAKMYRMTHAFNTGSEPGFDQQNNSMETSPQGDLAIFTTDMMGTRGDNNLGSTQSQNIRGMLKPSSGLVLSIGNTIYPSANNAGNYIYNTTVGGTTSGGAPTGGWCQTPNCTAVWGSATVQNIGANTNRGDAVIVDFLSAHPAP
jgi:hypothetical protein